MPSFSFATLIGYSRIYLGVHYPTDVLAGAVLGVTLGLAFGVCGRWLVRRLTKTGSASPVSQSGWNISG